MAPHVPTPNVVRVTLYATLHTVPIETAVFFRKLAPPITQASIDLLANRLGGQWIVFFMRQLGRDLVLRELVVEDLTAGSGLSSVWNTWFGISPQTISVPTNIAISFRQLGPAIPRPWQWIIRWPAVPEAMVTGNVLDTTWAENLRLGIRDRYTLQGAFGWQWCVVQKVLGGVPLTEGIPHEVTNLAVASPYAAPMRRRLTNP